MDSTKYPLAVNIEVNKKINEKIGDNFEELNKIKGVKVVKAENIASYATNVLLVNPVNTKTVQRGILKNHSAVVFIIEKLPFEFESYNNHRDAVAEFVTSLTEKAKNNFLVTIYINRFVAKDGNLILKQTPTILEWEKMTEDEKEGWKSYK